MKPPSAAGCSDLWEVGCYTSSVACGFWGTAYLAKMRDLRRSGCRRGANWTGLAARGGGLMGCAAKSVFVVWFAGNPVSFWFQSGKLSLNPHRQKTRTPAVAPIQARR